MDEIEALTAELEKRIQQMDGIEHSAEGFAALAEHYAWIVKLMNAWAAIENKPTAAQAKFCKMFFQDLFLRLGQAAGRAMEMAGTFSAMETMFQEEQQQKDLN